MRPRALLEQDGREVELVHRVSRATPFLPKFLEGRTDEDPETLIGSPDHRDASRNTGCPFPLLFYAADLLWVTRGCLALGPGGRFRARPTRWR